MIELQCYPQTSKSKSQKNVKSLIKTWRLWYTIVSDILDQNGFDLGWSNTWLLVMQM